MILFNYLPCQSITTEQASNQIMAFLIADLSVHDAEYDTLFQTMATKIVSNVVGVFGSTCSGKSSLVNELIRVKAIPQNDAHSTPSGGSGAVLTPEFIFSKGRFVSYDTIFPAVRVVKPVPGCTYDRVLREMGVAPQAGTPRSSTNPFSEWFDRGVVTSQADAKMVTVSSLKEPLLATVQPVASALPERSYGLPRDPLDEAGTKLSAAENGDAGVKYTTSPNAHLQTNLFGGPPLLVITKAPDPEDSFDAQAIAAQKTAWKSKLDQICSMPIANNPAQSPLASHITHTTCLDVFDNAKVHSSAKLKALDTVFGKCDSLVSREVFHGLLSAVGMGAMQLDEAVDGKTGVPTSLTLVNATGVLQELYGPTLESARTNNQPSLITTLIARISQEKHRLVSSAFVEFDFGNRDPYRLLPAVGGGADNGESKLEKRGLLTRLFSSKSNTEIAPPSANEPTVVASPSTPVKSSRTSPFNRDALLVASSVIRGVDKLLYCLPCTQLSSEEAAAVFFKSAFQVAVEGKASCILDPTQLALCGGVVTPDKRILQIQPVVTKVDMFCSVHRHGVDLALVTGKKAANALFDRFVVPPITPLPGFGLSSVVPSKSGGPVNDDDDSTPSIGDNGGAPTAGVPRPRTCPFTPQQLPKPIVVACDGYNGFLPDSTRDLDRAFVFVGNKKKYELLPDITFEKLDTRNLCDWLVYTKLNLLRSRGNTRPTVPPQSTTPDNKVQQASSGTVPTSFASDTIDRTAEMLRSSPKRGDPKTLQLQEQLVTLLGSSLRCASF